MHYEKFLRPSDPEGHKVWVLIELGRGAVRQRVTWRVPFLGS